MANQFIGLQMLVTIKDPPQKLKGIVSDVEAGLSLTLNNGLSHMSRSDKTWR
jgi:enhancer of mRNA-decapping protein 3